MQEIFGKDYYIDLDGITEKCSIKSTKTVNEEEGEIKDDATTLEINIFKYEIIKMCIDRLFAEFENNDDDDKLLGKQSQSVSFNLAFNTLIKYNVIIEDE